MDFEPGGLVGDVAVTQVGLMITLPLVIVTALVISFTYFCGIQLLRFIFI